MKGFSLAFGSSMAPAEFSEEAEKELMELPLAVKRQFGKPIIVLLIEETKDAKKLEFEADRRRVRDFYLSHGIPVYPTEDRAIRALGHLVKYQQRLAVL